MSIRSTKELAAPSKLRPAEAGMPLEDGAKINATAKICSVFKALAARSPQRLNELAVSAGLNRATAFRILEDLAAAGMVEKKGAPPRYDFGPEVALMAAASFRSWDIQKLAQPSLLRLADLTGDTVVLHVRSNAESLCVDRVVGDYPIRANLLDIGSRRPLGVGAGSMALLAWLPDTERSAVLDITCSGLQSYPRFNRKMMETFIEESKASGIVTMCDVIVDRMGAMAIPLPDRHGNIRAAISIAALTERIQQRTDMMADALRTEAKTIAKAMK